MKVCIFGVGAVGGLLAHGFGQSAGCDVSIVTRGAHLEAIQARGLTLVLPNGEQRTQRLRAVSSAAELGEQDYVFVTLKTYSQPESADQVAALLGACGVAVFVCNGIPWWWSHGLPATAVNDAPSSVLDPDQRLWRLVQPERVIGCVAYSTNELTAPGVVQHAGNNLWKLGEPDGSASSRLAHCSDLLRTAGFHTETTDDIRRAVWVKLLRNASLSPLSALTRCAIGELGERADMLAIIDVLVDEIASIARATGHDLSGEVALAKGVAQRASEKSRLAAAHGVAKSDTPSMLQDVLRGKPIEVEAILGVPHEFAHRAGISCPTLSMLLSLLRALNSSAGRRLN
ncbi:MAG: 2-dehydropantoate 2-reductase [Betaproteobacteria bacterium]|nr:MAG: 2-dehydropantoate 2-reductase [Betaproteobacteria bacterium]